ncbi:MAG: amidohydrolase family protein [Candidatus Thorarchaeota archaeon]
MVQKLKEIARQMKVIDSHLHVNDDKDLFGRDLTFTWEDLNSYLGIVSRVQLMPAFENTDDSREANHRFFKKIKSLNNKNQIWGFYWPHPHEVDPDFLKTYDIAGIKYHPSVSQLEVHKATAVLDLVEDTGLPLIVHCGRNIKSRIEYCIEAYKKRNITIIAAHLGGVAPPLVSRALQMLEGTDDFDNFYLDTSSIDVARLIARAINVVGSERILFGTDIPFHEYHVLKYALQQVWERDDVRVTSQDMKNILYANVERIHTTK